MAYIDLIVLIVAIVFVVIYSKRLQTYFFGFGMIDIAFRILNIIKGFLPKGTRKMVSTYIPNAAIGVINKYTSGSIEVVLTLIYAAVMAIFLFYIVKIFIKRKKI